MIKGKTLNLGGTDYIVPPLSLGSVELLQERIEQFRGGIDKESVATVIDCLHLALQRNYPQITRSEAAELADIGSMGDIMQAVMGISGLMEPDPEAGKPMPVEASTGTISTPD